MTSDLLRGPAFLFCPADRPDRFDKALQRADAVILDLEDAVRADRKRVAREEIAVSTLPSDRVIVRVNRNPLLASEDLASLRRTNYTMVMVGKAEAAADLDVWPGFRLIPQIETAVGFRALGDIAAHPDVIALAWGGEDLTLSLGADRAAILEQVGGAFPTSICEPSSSCRRCLEAWARSTLPFPNSPI
jgi:citrate lyase subunit beta/citryl-CoA lyase